MFIELNQILLQSRHCSHDYWEDCGLLEAEDCLRSFQSQDWQTLAQSLPNQPEFWRLNLIAVLQQIPSPESVYILAQLRQDAQPSIAREAKRTIVKMARSSQQESDYTADLQQLAADIAAEKKPFRLFHFLHRKQPHSPAVWFFIMSQYFNLFQLPVQFNLDEQKLEQTYRDLAARFHPDKFAAASTFEQKQAVMMSATINEAYQTLKNPLDRASYLLKMQNIEADAPEHTAFAPEFLMQQMEWRETLMDAQMEQNQTAIVALDNEIRDEQQSLFDAINSAFAKEDYDNAARLVRHGRFLNKLRSEIAAAL